MTATPRRIPLVGSFDTRGINAATNFTTYDQLYQDVIFVPVKNDIQRTIRVFVEKRPGFAAQSAVSGIASVQVNSVFWWPQALSGVGRTVIGANNTLGTAVLVLVSDTVTAKSHGSSSTPRNFTEGYNSSGTPFLMWTDTQASTAWGYPDGGASAQISTVPSTYTGRLEYMDGWTFVATYDMPRIYNSNLNDPTAGYTAYVPCASSVGVLISAVKYGKFIIAMGQGGMDWFYNAGNPQPGSPLSRITDQSVLARYSKMGLLGNANAHVLVTEGGGSLWFLSSSGTGTALYRITGTELTKAVDNVVVQRILQQITYSTSVTLKYIEWAGIGIVLIGLGTTTALAYFPAVGLWSYWTGVRWSTLCVQSNAPTLTPYRTFSADTPGVWSSSSPVYQDYGSNITRLIRTSVMDFGSTTRKSESKLRIVGDKQTSSQLIAVRTSDNDATTWSTARNIDMNLTPAEIDRGGVFYRRIYEISDTNNANGRIEALEPWIEQLGT